MELSAAPTAYAVAEIVRADEAGRQPPLYAQAVRPAEVYYEDHDKERGGMPNGELQRQTYRDPADLWTPLADRHVVSPEAGPPGRRFVFPRNLSVWRWISIFLVGLLNLSVWAVLLYFFSKYVLLDSKGSVKPFKASCFDTADMNDYICFFSAGQVSYGIISVGQVNIGLLCLGQVNIGLLACIGQVAASMGFAVGQVATGWYVPVGQAVIAMYKVRYAQVGVQFLKYFFPDNGKDPKIFVSCHS
jgi:hypothetical protein